MKKIITIICFIGIIQNGFAKGYVYDAYFNYTQNTGGGGIWVVTNNITATIGDSIRFTSYFSQSGSIQNPDNWYLDGVLIPNTAGQQIFTIVVNQPGNYSAYINNSSQGWSNWVYFNVTTTTGIPSLKNINSLTVYPTAVTSSITIQLNSIKPNDIEIAFYDINGKQLKTDYYKNIAGEFIKNENTEALAEGMYLLRIKTGEEVVEKKFVKM